MMCFQIIYSHLILLVYLYRNNAPAADKTKLPITAIKNPDLASASGIKLKFIP